jgi:hypothetical protein
MDRPESFSAIRQLCLAMTQNPHDTPTIALPRPVQTQATPPTVTKGTRHRRGPLVVLSLLLALAVIWWWPEASSPQKVVEQPSPSSSISSRPGPEWQPVLFGTQGISMLEPTRDDPTANRLSAWEKSNHGSWGSDLEGEGIIGVTPPDLLSTLTRPIRQQNKKLSVAMAPLDMCLECGLMLRWDNGDQVRLRVKNLLEQWLIQPEWPDAWQQGVPEPQVITEVEEPVTLTMEINGGQLTLFINETPHWHTAITAPPSSFSLYNTGGQLRIAHVHQFPSQESP